jgi:TRAP-type C4-dicarboxylate transport system permease small subunit
MKNFYRLTEKICQVMDWIGGVVLVFMMLLTVADVIMRYLGKPVLGTYELVSLAGAIVVGCAMPHTSWENTHVTVDMLLEKMEKTRKNVLQIITRIMGFLLFGVVGVNLIDMGTTLTKTGESTLTLVLPLYPFVYVLGVCCFAECLVLLSQIIRLASKEASNE